ncbi:hypothetical protein NL526_28445, partial [Klebsiella pneumoniae]|nr:hypothetical protein [Klebsiella pneumoniae]
NTQTSEVKSNQAKSNQVESTLTLLPQIEYKHEMRNEVDLNINHHTTSVSENESENLIPG